MASWSPQVSCVTLGKQTFPCVFGNAGRFRKSHPTYSMSGHSFPVVSLYIRSSTWLQQLNDDDLLLYSSQELIHISHKTWTGFYIIYLWCYPFFSGWWFSCLRPRPGPAFHSEEVFGVFLSFCHVFPSSLCVLWVRFTSVCSCLSHAPFRNS